MARRRCEEGLDPALMYWLLPAVVGWMWLSWQSGHSVMLCLHTNSHLLQAAERIAAQMEQLRDFDITIEQLRLAAVGGAGPACLLPACLPACLGTCLHVYWLLLSLDSHCITSPGSTLLNTRGPLAQNHLPATAPAATCTWLCLQRARR